MLRPWRAMQYAVGLGCPQGVGVRNGGPEVVSPHSSQFTACPSRRELSTGQLGALASPSYCGRFGAVSCGQIIPMPQ